MTALSFLFVITCEQEMENDLLVW